MLLKVATSPDGIIVLELFCESREERSKGAEEFVKFVGMQNVEVTMTAPEVQK